MRMSDKDVLLADAIKHRKQIKKHKETERDVDMTDAQKIKERKDWCHCWQR